MSGPDTLTLTETETGAMPTKAVELSTTGTGHSINSEVDNSKDKKISNNDWGPWVAIASLLGGLAFGGVIVLSLLVPDLMEARAKAEAAEGQVNFRIAERETRLIREDIKQIQTQLAQKGIEIQLNSH